jgi:hypothetical protein
MKRILSMAIVPAAAALGACTSSSPAQPSSEAGAGVDSAAVDGGTGDDSGEGGSQNNFPIMMVTQYQADLSGAQVAPASVQTGASGTATFTLSADGVSLGYDITFAPAGFVSTAVNLHVGAVGQNTAVAHQLVPISDHMTGQIMLTADEQSALTGDLLYLDVQTQAYPYGELRGQLVLPGSEIFVAAATGAQQVPGIKSAYTGHASFILSPDQGALIYHVETSATPTDVRLHRGIGGASGQVAYDLPIGNGLPADGTIQIGGAAGNKDTDDLQNGRFYLNLVTQQNPAGELRGQLIHPGETLFAGTLSGANEVPPVTSTASGGSQLILSPDQSSVRYEATVNGIIPTAAEMCQGMAGQNGSAMYQLTLNQSGALGKAKITMSDVRALMTGRIYVNVKTPSYAGGELRAQLTHQ